MYIINTPIHFFFCYRDPGAVECTHQHARDSGDVCGGHDDRQGGLEGCRVVSYPTSG